MPETPYGQYILTTGDGIVGQIEMVWGRFWYESRFQGIQPVADVGPGRCWFTRQNPSAIVAIDNAPDLVEHYAAHRLHITLGSAYEIPFPDAYFQGVFCCWLFEHLPDPARAILEIYRVLKPGGRCCIVVPTPADMVAFYADYTHIRPFTVTSLGQLAAAGGFARARTENLPFTRGMRYIYRHFGAAASYRYMLFADRYLRHLGICNRDHLVLDAWK
ncbi:MAG TPA: class I SAM-dependent methyltransferase [Bryobacteraceae bacterium]|jgi:SAM-dependent methyltransferase|nr:class I SAM-dependent methyltransferase [Bryobacteraceae bacterium]